MPVLALFGERGAGKSVALLQERQSLEAAQAAARWVNLGRCQTERQVGSALADAAAAREAGEWWVFLDSVDEGLNVLPALGGLIADDCDRWAATKRRSCPATNHTLKSVDRHQQQQAQMQRDLKGVPVAAFTLDCTLP